MCAYAAFLDFVLDEFQVWQKAVAFESLKNSAWVGRNCDGKMQMP